MRLRWWYVAMLAALAAAAGGMLFLKSGKRQEVQLVWERSQLPAAITTSSPAASPALPSNELNLSVPFMTQAPLVNWDALHEETCEEASVAMADAFFGRRTFTPQSAEDELQALVAWQKKRFGYFESTTAEEVAIIIREYYGRTAEVTSEVTPERIKRELAAGHLIALPAYGKGLNPFFRNGGPLYHMLVIKGYTATRLITNDPGTRHGQDYPYSYKQLISAAHDWNNGDVPNGRKVMIIIQP